MNQRENNKSIKIAIHGVPHSTHKILCLFFKQISEHIKIVNDADSPDVDLIDIDFAGGDKILAKQRAEHPERIFVITSLKNKPNTIEYDYLFLKKPLTRERIIQIIMQCQLQLKQPTIQKKQVKAASKPSTPQATVLPATVDKKPASPIKPPENHTRPAEEFNEKGFTHFIGLIPTIDIKDPAQIAQACFSPEDYFLGYVYNAIKISHHKKQVLQVDASWRPLLIFPHSHEIWLDANEHQLRAFAGLKISRTSEGKVRILPVNLQKTKVNQASDKFQNEESFLWKLAIWTSKGRYPQQLDPTKPIVLKHWPNFTRLVITPHALRITALLIQQPQSMLDVAKTLNIGAQYVFVFISGCQALNLVAQIERKPGPEEKTKKKNNASGLLSKLLNKLRAKNHDDTA
ncbi:hypothetical protein [methane-oxidizing endosymbiont of Gigantopelta aegis]|uniref:hypothetical protein n=1 Tax=methane-oxidizing endosymbiont of Gigantopelta aegis TaxID=2794938 RepID=UPI0018DD0FDD|nr:hypothetical protein [methane-oxidizing endosymbiont of Gigantopelta aegis]